MKKQTFLTSLVLGIASLLLHFSCKDEICRAPVQDSPFGFKLVDRFGTNQIAEWGARYNSDSTFLTKENGEIPTALDISGGTISFFIPDSYIEALDTEVTRIFLLYLPDYQGNPKADVDTLKFKYRFKLAGDVICYDYLQVMYNDSLYHSGNYEYLMNFTK